MQNGLHIFGILRPYLIRLAKVSRNTFLCAYSVGTLSCVEISSPPCFETSRCWARGWGRKRAEHLNIHLDRTELVAVYLICANNIEEISLDRCSVTHGRKLCSGSGFHLPSLLLVAFNCKRFLYAITVT